MWVRGRAIGMGEGRKYLHGFDAVAETLEALEKGGVLVEREEKVESKAGGKESKKRPGQATRAAESNRTGTFADVRAGAAFSSSSIASWG